MSTVTFWSVFRRLDNACHEKMTINNARIIVITHHSFVITPHLRGWVRDSRSKVRDSFSLSWQCRRNDGVWVLRSPPQGDFLSWRAGRTARFRLEVSSWGHWKLWPKVIIPTLPRRLGSCGYTRMLDTVCEPLKIRHNQVWRKNFVGRLDWYRCPSF